MFSLRNKVQLIGNLGKSPDVKNTEAGKKLVRFSVATNETYTNTKGEKVNFFSVATNETYTNTKGEKVKETQWHNLVAWGKVADIAEKYLDKGSEVAIEGKLISKDYLDKEGVKKYVTEIQVNELLLLGSKGSA